MARLTFTQDNLPATENFGRMLNETMAKSNPVDELIELSHELYELEREFGMKSAEFHGKYERGEMGDNEKVMHWAMLYHSFLERKKRVEAALIREAVWHKSELVPA